MRTPLHIPNLAVTGMLCLLQACSSGQAPPPIFPAQAPARIIFFVADGAGAAHWTLAAFADEDLAVRRMKTIGLVDTRGSDHTVSGSAPTATAYATGVRSFMGAVGVGPDSLPVESIVEVAIARGMSTGLMTTTYVADATPAAFGAHAVSRTALGDMGVVAQRGTALQDMTSTALQILDRNPNGFFLMVENEESDTQSHQNADQATTCPLGGDLGPGV